MTRFLVLHGAGIDMRGKVQLDVFGKQTMRDYEEHIDRYASELGVDVEVFHSNIEGELVNRLYRAHDDGIDGALVNPGGFTRGYPALNAAIAQVGLPVFEVHISNPARRGVVSEVAGAARGAVAGFGTFGYYLALRGLLEIVSREE